MKVWNSFPMLRLILPFLVGVISASFSPEFFSINHKLVSLIGMVSGGFVLIALLITLRLRQPFWFGLFLWPIFMLLGSFLTLSVTHSVFPDYLNRKAIEGFETSYVAVISDQPQLKPKSVKITAELMGSDRTSHGKVLLYFKKDSASERLKYGEQILIRTKLEKVKGMGNPNEFNYTRYLRFHNISFRGYVKSGAWEVLSKGNPGVRGWFFDVRSRMIQLLEKSGLDGNELSVASALILGFRTDLDKDLMTAYAGAGATHVLAVSGLHVGIVYMILNFILSFLLRFKHGRIIRTFLVIAVLGSYAALTGLSPSVCRAATMFTFVAIGSAIERNTNIFNTLAASAFVLILYEPMIIMQVGFQLSYAAVIGIVLIQPRLFKLFTFKNRLADWAWSITCVSVAAQIATFPLGLLYFHQFPNLFLISNLLVIPAAAGILYLGFSLFLFSFWEPTLLFFGFLLKTLISSLNQVVVWIEKVPYSVLSGIDISTVESLIIYLITAGILVFIIQKKRKGLYASLTLAVVFMTLQIIEVHQQKNQKFATLYNVKGETVLALVNGTQVALLSSKKFNENEQAKLFHVRHHWWNKGIEKGTFIELSDSLTNRRLEWNGKSFAILDFRDSEKRSAQLLNNEELGFAILDDSDWNNCKVLADLNSDSLLVSNKFGQKMLARVQESTTGEPAICLSQTGMVEL